MFFILSKTAALLLVPSNLLIGIGLAGVVLLFTRWRRAGTGMMAISIVVLVLVAFLPFGTFLMHTLETRFPPWIRHAAGQTALSFSAAPSTRRSRPTTARRNSSKAANA